MDVAVVIPVFNGSRWIGETLQSVLAQSQAPAEIVVVDDGSEDDSTDIVRSVPGITLLRSPGKGVQVARNFGFWKTRSPLVAFLDQDDLWHPEHLRDLRAILVHRPEYPAAVSAVELFTDAPRWEPPRRKSLLRAIDPWRFYPFHRFATASAVLYRRGILEAEGGWPTAFQVADDYIALLFVSSRSALALGNRFSTAHRQHPASLSRRWRAAEAATFLDVLKTGLEAAGQRRLSFFPEQAEELRHRLGLFDAFAAILRSLLDDRPGALRPAALEFERCARNFPAWYMELAVGFIPWFLEPVLGSGTSPAAQRLVEFARACWPAEARRSRKVIERIFEMYGIH